MRIGRKFSLILQLESFGIAIRFRFPRILCAGPSNTVEWAGFVVTNQCTILKSFSFIFKHFLTTSGIPNRFKNNTPGKKWFFHFRKRHADLTLRTAQNFPRNRAESLSKKVIEDFYKMVKDKYDELDMYGKPTHIWNADETGFSGDQGRQLILCKKGLKKYIFSL